jgi:hypothetical protein
MDNNKIGVALVKRLSPCCAKPVDGEIYMNTRLSTKAAKEVESMNDKVVGWSDDYCDVCKGYMKTAIMAVLYDETKTTDMANPYRTGQLYGLTEDAVKRLFGYDEEFLEAAMKHRMFYLSAQVGEEIGIFKMESGIADSPAPEASEG